MTPSTRSLPARPSSGEATVAAASTLRNAPPATGYGLPVTKSLMAELRADPPLLHGRGECWGLEWRALAWLEQTVTPEMATLETGTGTSTLVFAAAETRHEAITPSADEADRVRAECERHSIRADHVRFHIGPSHEVLPAWDSHELDLALIDGAHGFPYPMLDWWHIAPHLRVAGLLVIDDAYMPAVRVLLDHLRSDPAWEIAAVPGYRTAVVRKRSNALPTFDWCGRRGTRFDYLPHGRRLLAAARYRMLDTGVGGRLVARARGRRPRGLT
jgi:predicted O-methyltransferase YrrM